MPQLTIPLRTARRMLIPLAAALVSATVAFAQSQTPASTSRTSPISSWENAQSRGSRIRNLLVVAKDQPGHEQACRVQSFTEDKLVCSRAFGGNRTYLPQQVAALIIRGDAHERVPWLVGLNSAMGAAIWGTVALLGICPPCAVGTGIVAFLLFAAAGVIAIADDQPDFLLYLAPGQQLTGKLRHVQQ